MCRTLARFTGVLGVAALTLLAALAQSAPASAATMLEIDAGGVRTEFTSEEIDGFDQVVIDTGNDFSDGVAKFEGPLARDVIGASGGSLEGMGVFVAANDYRVEIPLEDFVNYDVIFATSMNGNRLSLRDKGPIWIIYPMTDNPELHDSAFNARLIWQLVKIELK